MNRKPNAGISAMASTAARMPPTAYPENIIAWVRLRRPGSAYSAVSATAVGMTPPRPIPPDDRKAPNQVTSGASAHPISAASKTITAKHTPVTRNSGRRRAVGSVRTAVEQSLASWLTPGASVGLDGRDAEIMCH